MNWRYAIIFMLLPLAACDGPQERKALAQCKLSNDGGALETCMQAKGFVTDKSLVDDFGAKCSALEEPADSAGCYRPDGPLGKWLAENGRTNSN